MILLLSLALACNEPEIVCRSVCIQDGDARGLLIDNQCYCANPRDISKIIVKIPGDLKGKVVIDQKRWFE